MSRERIEMHRLQDLVRLHRLGRRARKIARQLKMSPNTERAYRMALDAAGLLLGDPTKLPEICELKQAVLEQLPLKSAPQQVSSAQKYDEEIRSALAKGARPKAIWDLLRLKHKDDFDVRLRALQRYCCRVVCERGVQPEDVAIPVQTGPGEVAQVDFGFLGCVYDPECGKERKAYVFVMVLGYSRHLYAELVFDQKTTTWLQLHVNAFAALGGVVRTVVPDNLKAAVIRAAFGVDGPTSLNRSYRELARYYGFEVDPTPVYAPKKKGKVESSVKFVKGNFYAPRRGMDARELRRELAVWSSEIAGKRIHGTTQRRPLEVFGSEERETLLALASRPYELVLWKEATLHRDSHVIHEKAYYSAPWRLIGKKLWVHATPTTVKLYYDDLRVATHRRAAPGQRRTVEEHLPEHRAPYRHRQRSYWEEKADALSSEVGKYIREVFNSDDVLSQLRTVISMVTMLEKYPTERAERACARAQFYGNYRYGGLKDILRRGLDFEPLPPVTVCSYGGLTQAVYARQAADFLQPSHLLEVPHESQ